MVRDVPTEFTKRLFTLREARAAGISRDVLSGRSWRRVGRGLYCWAGLREDPWHLLAGWRRLLPNGAAFAGRSAAWLHGIDLDPLNPIEVVVAPGSGARSRAGLKVRRAHVERSELVKLRGLPATALLRTLRDLCRPRNELEALIAFDSALRRALTDKATLHSAGTGHMRHIAACAEPAESPMETRLRWLLIKSGLPRPEVQKDLHDAKGAFVGRADLYYRDARLVIEYDGANHRDRLVDDDRRQNALIGAGYTVLRFTASDIFAKAEAVVAEVSAAAAASATPRAAARR